MTLLHKVDLDLEVWSLGKRGEEGQLDNRISYGSFVVIKPLEHLYSILYAVMTVLSSFTH